MAYKEVDTAEFVERVRKRLEGAERHYGRIVAGTSSSGQSDYQKLVDDMHEFKVYITDWVIKPPAPSLDPVKAVIQQLIDAWEAHSRRFLDPVAIATLKTLLAQFP